MKHLPEPQFFEPVLQPARPYPRKVRAGWLGRLISRAAERYELHRAYTQLETLPDHLLRDMGIHREDISNAKLELRSGNF